MSRLTDFQFLLYPKPQRGYDSVKFFGSSLGAAVDLSYLVRMSLLWLNSPHFGRNTAVYYDENQNPIPFEDVWAQRKRTDASQWWIAAIVNGVDALLYAYVYPAMGKWLYRSPRALMGVFLAKSLASAHVMNLILATNKRTYAQKVVP